MVILNQQPRKASSAGLERRAGALRTMATGALGRVRGWVERCPHLLPLSPQLGDPSSLLAVGWSLEGRTDAGRSSISGVRGTV